LGGAWLQGEDVRTVVDLSGHGPGSGLLTTPAGQLAIVAPTDDLTGTAPPEAGGVGWIHQLLAQLTLRRQVGADTSLLRLGGDDHASLASLLDVLGEPGPLRPVPLGDAVPALAAGELEAQGQPLQDLGPIADSLVEVRARLATYESFYVDGADSPARYRALIRQSLGVGTDPSEQASAIDEIDREVLAALDVVSLPQNQSVTLAARSVPIPLTITNAATGTREVLLQFRSDKLMVAEDGHVIRIGPGTSSIDIQVDARSLGVSPLEVRVLTPDGERMLASTRFQVRSTAVPGLGLLLSAIGLVLLGMWWWVSIRRRRSEQPPGSGDGDQASDQDEHRPSGHDAKDGDHRREHDRGSTLLGGSV
jgi:hypothetical protein